MMSSVIILVKLVLAVFDKIAIEEARATDLRRDKRVEISMSFLYQPWFGRKQTPRPLKKRLSQANRTNVERADFPLVILGSKTMAWLQ
jgi:hypothetical protein